MRKILTYFLLLFPSYHAFAQIGIGTTTPHASSLLHLESNNKGFLLPRMTQAQRNAIVSPATGLLIYQTNIDPGLYYYDGSAWQHVYPGGDNLGDHKAAQNIELQGNYLSNDGDDEGVYVANNGNVGINTISPSSELHVHQPSASFSTFRLTHASTIGLGLTIQNNTVGSSIMNYENLRLSLGTNGVDRIIISNSGNVGIGTINPIQLLHLRQGAGGPVFYLQHADNITNTGTTLSSIIVSDANTSSNQAQILFERDAMSSGPTDLPTSISFWTTKDGSNTLLRQMTIDNIGNVGVGTSSPSVKLDVNGIINSTSGFRVNGNAAPGTFLKGDGLNYGPGGITVSDIPPGSNAYIQNQIFSDQPASFRINNNGTNTAIIRSTSTAFGSSALLVENTATTLNATFGITANISSSNGSTAAIRGTATSATGAVTGVLGEASSPTTLSSGVKGTNSGAGETVGVYGINSSNGTNSSGIRGLSQATTAASYGIHGVAISSNTNSAAVYGVHNHATAGVNGVIGEVVSSSTSAKAIYGKAPNSGFGGYFEGKGYFSGNLGIGTTTPGTPLNISTTNGYAYRLESSSTFGTWSSFYNSSTGGQWFHLINTGQANSQGAGKFMIIRGINSTTTTGSPSIIIDHNNNYVGINTSNPDQPLSVNGNASKPGGGNWAVFSDKRLKTNVKNFSLGLSELMQIQPVYYEYKKDNPLGIVSEGVHTGFIAQDIEKVIPDAVIYNKKSGFLSLNHDPILWTTLNAVKELNLIKADKKEFEALKIENSQLKQEIQVLKNRLSKLEVMIENFSNNQ